MCQVTATCETSEFTNESSVVLCCVVCQVNATCETTEFTNERSVVLCCVVLQVHATCETGIVVKLTESSPGFHKTYYSSTKVNKYSLGKCRNMEKDIHGPQMGLLNYLIRAKCHSEYSSSYWEKYFLLKKVSR
jgi:hypothetical protein